MESLEFSEDEIKSQLAALGYFNVSEERMKQFRKDLHKLIEHDRSGSGSSSWYTGVSSPSANSDASDSFNKPRAYPAMSRYQPHIKYPAQQESMTQSSRNGESSWLAQSDINRLTSRADVHRRFDSQQTDTIEASSDGVSSLSLHDRTRPRAALKSMENTSELSTALRIPVAAVDTPSVATESSDDSDDSHEPLPKSDVKVIRKRKVLRKQTDGTPRVYDESLVEDSTRGLHRIHDVSMDDSDPRLFRVTPKHHLPPRPHSTKPSGWGRDSSLDTFDGPDHLPSYIRPNTSHPHTRNLKKTDPVNRYHQYRDFWTNLKAPGEKSHKDLRWEVKAQMMYKEETAPKPQRVYVPNTYVVPTSKKRSALRWEVRHAMENGLPLPTTYDVY